MSLISARREPIRPVHVPVVVKECLGKIDTLALPGSFEFFVVEYKFRASAPVVNNLIHHGTLALIGKDRAATPGLRVGSEQTWGLAQRVSSKARCEWCEYETKPAFVPPRQA